MSTSRSSLVKNIIRVRLRGLTNTGVPGACIVQLGSDAASLEGRIGVQLGNEDDTFRLSRVRFI